MSSSIMSRTGEDMAAEVAMMSTSSKGPFIFVEGPTDELFLNRWLRRDCYISIGSGKTTVEKAVSILDAGGVGLNYLGVVDEDYDWLIGYDCGSQNIVKTDPRDAEGVMLRCGALDAVIAEYGDRQKCASYEINSGHSILEGVLARAEPFGRIRMVNSMGPMVDVSSIKPIRFFVAPWSYDVDLAIEEAVKLGVAESAVDLRQKMDALNPPDLWHCVRGHDLVDILCGGLIGCFGRKGVSSRNVESLLRQGLNLEQFRSTRLFSGLESWSTARGVLLTI